MKITCGTDIIEIERIKKAIENIGDKFLNTVFTEKEIEYCESRKNQRYQHYAVRFAAKEAIFKAISGNTNNNCDWKSFEVERQENGRPRVNVLIDMPNLVNIDLSMSHCKQYATANVVAIFNE